MFGSENANCHSLLGSKTFVSLNTSVILSNVVVCRDGTVNSFALLAPSPTMAPKNYPTKFPTVIPTATLTWTFKPTYSKSPFFCSDTTTGTLSDSISTSLQKALNNVGCSSKCNTSITQTNICGTSSSSSRKLLSMGTAICETFSFVKILFKLDVIAETLGYSSDTATQLNGYVQSSLEESVSTGTFIALSQEYATALNDSSLDNSNVAESFVVHTTQIEYLVTVSPTATPTVTPSSPTRVPTKGAETFVTFQAITTLTGLPIPSATARNDSRYLTSESDTVSLLSYVVYTLLGLTSASTVNTALVADEAANYVTTFTINILAESLGYTAASVNALYTHCISILTDSVTSGDLVNSIKSEAADWGYSDFNSVDSVGTISFSKKNTTYAYSNPPTVAPSLGRTFS